MGPTGSAAPKVPGAQITLPLSLPDPGAQDGLCMAGGGPVGGEPPLLTHVVTPEVPLTVTGLWEPKREGDL